MVFLYRNFEENIIKVNKLLDFFNYEETKNLQSQKIKLFKKLEIQKLDFTFDKNHQVLSSIDFAISSGEKMAII
jgi:ABC-type bacteriocin/lantibiotic exporter with double-glycine peptidase domain